MGAFDDLIPAKGGTKSMAPSFGSVKSGAFDDLIPKKPKGSIPMSLSAFGPLGRGSVAAQRGATAQDIPHLAAKTVSGFFAGAPEFLAKRPIAGPMEAFNPLTPGIFPKSKTREGEQLGKELELVGGAVDVGLLATKASSKIVPSLKTAYKQAGTEIPQGIKQVKREGLKYLADRPKVISNLQNVTRRVASKETYALREGVKQEADEMVRQLNQASREGALKAQRELPRYFKKHFDAYESGLDDLIASNKAKAPRNEVSRALESTLTELGLRGEHARPPSSPTESYLLELATDFADIRRHKEVVPPEILIDLGRQVKKTLPAGVKSGNQLYGAGEHAASVFKENYGKVLEKNVKGLSGLNSTYKRFFDVKREANRIFKPYAGKYGTRTAEQFLKRSGLPKTKGTVGDVFLSDLEA